MYWPIKTEEQKPKSLEKSEESTQELLLLPSLRKEGTTLYKFYSLCKTTTCTGGTLLKKLDECFRYFQLFIKIKVLDLNHCPIVSGDAAQPFVLAQRLLSPP